MDLNRSIQSLSGDGLKAVLDGSLDKARPASRLRSMLASNCETERARRGAALNPTSGSNGAYARSTVADQLCDAARVDSLVLESSDLAYESVARVRWLARSTESAVGSPRNDRNLASRGRNSAFSGRIDVQSDP